MRSAACPSRRGGELDLPIWIVALIAAAALLHVASFAWSFASHDFIRDLLAAGDIAAGTARPLRGPVINSMVHVGPLWFYVMSVPLALGGGLVGAMLWAGALSSLKVWAAWRFGNALAGPRFAGLLAALALLPGWSTIHQLQFTQTIVLELFVFCLLLPILRLWRAGSPAQWAWSGLWLGLAVQAHPIALFLLLPMAVAGARRIARWRADLPWMALGAALSVLPMTPMLWAEWRDGFPALATLHEFAASEAPSKRPWAFIGVLEGLTVQGARVTVDLAAALGAAPVAVVLYVVMGAALIAGLAPSLADSTCRRHAAAGLALAALAATWVTALRPTATYYLAMLAWPFLLVVAASILDGGGRSAFDRGRGITAILGAVALSVLGSAIVIQQGHSGRITLPLGGMLDVVEGTAGAMPVATMPAWATDALARRTCDAPDLVIRGELAAFLDFHQGVPWRWVCSRPPRIAVVAAPAGRTAQEVVVMSPAALQALGWTGAGWQDAITLAPSRVLSSGPAVPLPEPTLRHPHRAFDPAPPRDVEVLVSTLEGEALAVYSPLFVFDGGALVSARRNGQPASARVSTNSGSLFASETGRSAEWVLALRGRRPEQIEILTLRLPAEPGGTTNAGPPDEH